VHDNIALSLRSVWIKPIAATAVVLALLIGYNVSGDLHRSGVVAPAVLTQLKQQGLANVEVRLTVTPDSFNTTYLQAYGSLVGIHGKTANLLEVSPSGVAQIAAQYWVAAIQPYSP
jgi:hypothetical protein